VKSKKTKEMKREFPGTKNSAKPAKFGNIKPQQAGVKYTKSWEKKEGKTRAVQTQRRFFGKKQPKGGVRREGKESGVEKTRTHREPKNGTKGGGHAKKKPKQKTVKGEKKTTGECGGPPHCHSTLT